MADKDLDRADATWLSKKFGKYAPLNRVAVTKDALKETMEGAPTVFGVMLGFSTLLGAIVYPVDQPDIASLDTSFSYSDQGDGYEVFTYAADTPAIAVVRDGDKVRLYQVTAGNEDQGTTATWTLIDDAQKASLIALQIQSKLAARSANLSTDATAFTEGDDLSPITISYYDNVSQPWTNENGVIQRSATSERTEVVIPIQDISAEFAAEATEWQDVRTQINAGHYALPDEGDLANVSDLRTQKERIGDSFIDGGIAGGATGIALFTLLFGGCFGSHYRRRMHQEKEAKRYGYKRS